MKEIAYLGLILLGCFAAIAANNTMPFKGIEELQSPFRDEAIILLKESLAILSDNNETSYDLAKVTSVRAQYASGAVSVYTGELNDGETNKQCVVKIWESVPMNVRIECEGGENDIDISF